MSERDRFCTPIGERKANMDLRTAVISVLGGVGACSSELYSEKLKQIATMCQMEVTDIFTWQVREILKSLPCPLD